MKSFKLPFLSTVVVLVAISFFTGCSLIRDDISQSSDVEKEIESQGIIRVVFSPQNAKNTKLTNEKMETMKAILDYRLSNIGFSNKEITIDKLENISVYFLYEKGIDMSNFQSKMDLVSMVGLLTTQEIDEGKKDENGAYIPTEKIIFDGKEIKDIYLFEEKDNGSNLVIELNEIASKNFEEATQRLMGKRLGMFIDDQFISAPSIQAKISSGKLVVDCHLEKQEALDLCVVIKSGSLPEKLIVSSIKTIAPKDK